MSDPFDDEYPEFALLREEVSALEGNPTAVQKIMNHVDCLQDAMSRHFVYLIGLCPLYPCAEDVAGPPNFRVDRPEYQLLPDLFAKLEGNLPGVTRMGKLLDNIRERATMHYAYLYGTAMRQYEAGKAAVQLGPAAGSRSGEVVRE